MLVFCHDRGSDSNIWSAIPGIDNLYIHRHQSHAQPRDVSNNEPGSQRLTSTLNRILQPTRHQMRTVYELFPCQEHVREGFRCFGSWVEEVGRGGAKGCGLSQCLRYVCRRLEKVLNQFKMTQTSR